MDINKRELLDIKEIQLKKAFEKNNISILFMKSKDEVISYLKDILVDQKSVAVGGSATLNELGVINLIRESDVHFIDRYEEGLTEAELKQRFRESFFANILITSTNALTIDGCLYNIDGNGNRVAAMIYGPDQVIVIAGLNKLCFSEQEAIDRIKNIAAPANAIRLHRNTPCAKTGQCMNCFSPDRICCSYVKLAYQRIKKRIQVIIVEENLGY